jgi:hypothetical protein
MINIVTVFKRGGEYDVSYIRKLANGVRANLTIPFIFICLTDESDEKLGVFDHTSPYVIPLRHSWPGWWAKMEIFTLQGPLLYFDLDTVITGSIDGLARWILDNPGPLVMLRGFYRGDQCSGIMGWNGNMSWISDQFRINFGDQTAFHEEKHGVSMTVGNKRFRGDQDWLRELCRQRHDQVNVVMAQDIFPGICSYKVNVKPKGKLPTDARIVCFHGTPRPHEVKPQPEWLRKHWEE